MFIALNSLIIIVILLYHLMFNAVLLHSFLKTTLQHNKIPVYLKSGEGNSNPLQYSCLENPMVLGAWRATDTQEPGRYTRAWGHRNTTKR